MIDLSIEPNPSPSEVSGGHTMANAAWAFVSRAAGGWGEPRNGGWEGFYLPQVEALAAELDLEPIHEMVRRTTRDPPVFAAPTVIASAIEGQQKIATDLGLLCVDATAKGYGIPAWNWVWWKGSAWAQHTGCPAPNGIRQVGTYQNLGPAGAGIPPGPCQQSLQAKAGQPWPFAGMRPVQFWAQLAEDALHNLTLAWKAYTDNYKAAGYGDAAAAAAGGGVDLKLPGSGNVLQYALIGGGVLLAIALFKRGGRGGGS